jgi:hypothetical protein
VKWRSVCVQTQRLRSFWKGSVIVVVENLKIGITSVPFNTNQSRLLHRRKDEHIITFWNYFYCIVHWIIEIVWYHVKKVKQSHYRPWQALTVPGGWGSQNVRQSAHEGGKVVSPTHRPTLSWYSFLLEAESTAIVRSEGLCQWKIPVTPSGIEPATFRFVAQCLNHCANAYPLIPCYALFYCISRYL